MNDCVSIRSKAGRRNVIRSRRYHLIRSLPLNQKTWVFEHKVIIQLMPRVVKYLFINFDKKSLFCFFFLLYLYLSFVYCTIYSFQRIVVFVLRCNCLPKVYMLYHILHQKSCSSFPENMIKLQCSPAKYTIGKGDR